MAAKDVVESKVREIAYGAKSKDELLANLKENDIVYVDGSKETGYDNVYVPIENGYLRIFTPYRAKSYQVQRWRKTTIKYSGIPTFEPSGRRSF